VVASFWFFGLIYYWFTAGCGVTFNSPIGAFLFAVETHANNGNPSFNGCLVMSVFLPMQCLWSLFCDAFLIGTLYARLSRGQTRATSIIFSDKACISTVDGIPYFMFQACDSRKHSLLEANVRCYCFLQEMAPDGTACFLQHRAMRLSHPDDEINGNLLLNTPTLVVHRIDKWSPLIAAAGIGDHGPGNEAFRFPQLIRRPYEEDVPGTPVSTAQLRTAFKTKWFEVIVLLEGTEPSTSSTVQARHSYTQDDVVYERGFMPSLRIASDGVVEVDLDRLNRLTGHFEPCTVPSHA